MKRVYIYRKSDNTQVYDYASDDVGIVELNLFPFSDYDYVETGTSDTSDGPVDMTPKAWDKLSFMRRFNQDERIAIRMRRVNDPIAEDFMTLLEMATVCANTDQDVLDGMNYFRQLGVISQARYDQILYG